MEPRHRFRRVNEAVGTFVLVALAVLVLALYFSGRAQGWFERTHEIRVILPEEGAYGLNEGSAVFVMGVSAGWVQDIRVKGNRLVTTVKIRDKFRHLIRSDSTARLERTFVIAGDAVLHIDTGEGPELAENVALIAQSPEDFMSDFEAGIAVFREHIGPLVESTQGLVKRWSDVGEEMHNNSQELYEALKRVSQIVAMVAQGRGTVGRLVVDPEIVNEMQSLLQRTRSAVENVHTVLDNLEGGTAQLPDISDALASEATQLPVLTLQAQQTLREIEIFFDGLQRHWLFRGAMEQPDPPGRIPPTQLERGRE